jgi:hypothetical protein
MPHELQFALRCFANGAQQVLLRHRRLVKANAQPSYCRVSHDAMESAPSHRQRE